MGQVRDGELNNSINIPLYIMKDDTDMKCETIVNYIDTKVAGEEVIYRKLDVPSFVAGFLQQIITDFGFEIFQSRNMKTLILQFVSVSGDQRGSMILMSKKIRRTTSAMNVTLNGQVRNVT